MSSFKFRYPEWVDIEPGVWVQKWNDLFLLGKDRKADDRVYKSLMETKGELSGADFEQIGRWKEGCLKTGEKENGRWKPKTSAAYDIWMQAKENPPERPPDDKIDREFAAKFLGDWSERKFAKPSAGGIVQDTRFGLSRATTLLHFIGVGRFPIYDSGIWYGLERLGLRLPWTMTVEAYFERFVPLFFSIASECGLSQSIDDLRKLDNALRCYGRKEFPVDQIPIQTVLGD
jgi:hypothetical protein